MRASLIAVPLLFAFTASAANAQTLQEPYQEKLLNGLKVLVWNTAAGDKITVKIRIHSGSAFDPQGREGVMRLLAENIFPNDATRDYFREDLSGSLEIKSNYDYIEIDATAKADALLPVLETLANAVSNPAIDKDITTKLRNALLAKVKTLEADPAYVADRAVAKRLFGTFPYGRPEMGTVESLQKIEFPDLLDAKKRFLTADNATIAITGKFDRPLALRAIRRYFGPWLKSDKLVPATFKQPDPPDTNVLKIEMPGIEKVYSTTAQIAPARGDKDYFAMQILRGSWQGRYCFSNESLNGKDSYQAFLLRGMYLTAMTSQRREEIPSNSRCITLLMDKDGGVTYPDATQSDFDQAKTKVVSDYYQKIQTPSGLSDLWLDLDTFKLKSVADELRKLNDLTLSDVNALVGRLRKSPTVTVMVTAPFSAK